MRHLLRTVSIFVVMLSACNRNHEEKKIKKDEFVLVGQFINDTIPEGIIKFYDNTGKLQSKKTYKNGVLEGESLSYFPNGKTHTDINFSGGKELGYKLIYDSLGRLTYKTNFYFGKEIGSVYGFDNDGNVTEYSFHNFEDDMLYYCVYDSVKKNFNYPDDKFLIKASTSEVTSNFDDGVNVFLYIFAPPKLKLNYEIAYFNSSDSIVESFPVKNTNFFYQSFFKKRNDNLKLGVLVNKYDSLNDKHEVLIQYLKTTYP